MNIKNMTIYELRKAGLKVRVNHRRRIGDSHNQLDPLLDMKTIREENLQNKINAKGGQTTIELTDLNNKTWESSAYCNIIDSFNKKIAIRICLGRLAKQMSWLNFDEIDDKSLTSANSQVNDK